MAEAPHVRRHRLVLPAGAAQQEAPLRQQPRRRQEEFLDARLAVGQPVAEKAEIARETRVRRHRMMRRGVEPVVDGHAAPRPQRLIGSDDGRPPAIGQHHVELRASASAAGAGRVAISARVAGASTSQKMRSASAPRRLHHARSSSSSKMPTPLAFTTTSAFAASAITRRRPSSVAG